MRLTTAKESAPIYSQQVTNEKAITSNMNAIVEDQNETESKIILNSISSCEAQKNKTS